MNIKHTINSSLVFLLGLSLVFASEKLFAFPVPIYLPELLALALFLSVLLGQRQDLVAYFRFLPTQLKLPLFLLLLGLAGGVVFSVDTTDALGAAKTWFVFPVLFVWSFLSLRPQPIKALLWGIISFAVVETIIGAKGFLSGDPRLLGTFPSANMYAAAIAPILVMTIYLSLQKRWLWLVALFLFAGLLLSQSLGGLIGFSVGVLVLVFTSIRDWRRYLMVGLIIVTLVTGVLIAKNRFTNDSQSSLASRIQIWNTAYYLARIYPVTGIGLRSFSTHYQDNVQHIYRQPVEWQVPEPHNILLAFWLDVGLLGLLGMAGLLGWVLARDLRSLAGLALITILAHGLVDTPFFKTELAFLLWIYLGLGLAVVGSKEEDAK